MKRKPKSKEFNFLSLLISLCLLITVTPMVHGVMGSFVIYLILTFVLLSVIYMIRKEKGILFIEYALVLPSIVLIWISFLDETFWARFAANGFILVFIGVTMLIIQKKIFFSNEVQAHFIHGAISVYLLAGILWALIHSTVELVFPGSYIGAAHFKELLERQNFEGDFEFFLYYSFVTLTTLGYGDITPVRSLARNCAVIEVVSAQFYIATLVAALIGRISRKKRQS